MLIMVAGVTVFAEGLAGNVQKAMPETACPDLSHCEMVSGCKWTPFRRHAARMSHERYSVQAAHMN